MQVQAGTAEVGGARIQVEADERVIKTSSKESLTGNPILVGRHDGDDKQPRFQQDRFLGVIGGSGQVIALHPDITRRHL